MRRLFSIAFLNFKEATRDKFFLGVGFFFVFYLSVCVLLGKLSPGHADKVLRNAGLVGIEFTTLVLIIFSFIFSFFREKDTRILEVYLSSVGRGTYISGKLLGYFLIALFYIFFSGAAYAGILFIYGCFDKAVLAGLYTLFLKVSVIICISSVFSSLFSSPTMALLSSVFLYVASETSAAALTIVTQYGKFIQRFFVEVMYYLLPNMDKIDIKAQVVHGRVPGVDYFLWITFYVLVYNLFLWLINLYIFRKKEY